MEEDNITQTNNNEDEEEETKQVLNNLLKRLKPLNYEKRLFKKTCEYFVRRNKICKCSVEDFLSDEFLYEDNEALERAHKSTRSSNKMMKQALILFATLYALKKLT